jgi:hypothetical protein
MNRRRFLKAVGALPFTGVFFHLQPDGVVASFASTNILDKDSLAISLTAMFLHLSEVCLQIYAGNQEKTKIIIQGSDEILFANPTDLMVIYMEAGTEVFQPVSCGWPKYIRTLSSRKDVDVRVITKCGYEIIVLNEAHIKDLWDQLA